MPRERSEINSDGRWRAGDSGILPRHLLPRVAHEPSARGKEYQDVTSRPRRPRRRKSANELAELSVLMRVRVNFVLHAQSGDTSATASCECMFAARAGGGRPPPHLSRHPSCRIAVTHDVRYK
ncbi:hypothetical protein EVAR_68128_1 [Eumeta japonica]|uniref:Uncharacterized protein n=1 Tax=Eumeta variegata TaxID=151549 RepID=A0A4C1ZH47_EUMVA|nr:hypothetical protein EVAR_68128_1 [Eumeta japonica]